MKRLLMAAALMLFLIATPFAQNKPIIWSDQEKPIVEQLRGLRKLPDDVRVGVTKDLALKIRQLPVVPNKLKLAMGLAGLSTEGDFGHDTLQEVATTLADAIQEQPPKDSGPISRTRQPGSLRARERVARFSAIRGSHGQARSRRPASQRSQLHAD